MNQADDSSLEALVKMIKLTQDSKIIWIPTKCPTALDTNTFQMTASLVADYKGRRLRITKGAQKFEQPNYFITVGQKPPTPIWQPVVFLEIIDQNDQSLWAFPATKAIDDLYIAATFQAAGVNKFIQDVLEEE